jgi:hypothetical protein
MRVSVRAFARSIHMRARPLSDNDNVPKQAKITWIHTFSGDTTTGTGTTTRASCCSSSLDMIGTTRVMTSTSNVAPTPALAPALLSLSPSDGAFVVFSFDNCDPPAGGCIRAVGHSRPDEK